MKAIVSEEIREIFLGYFERHNHLRIASSSLVPENDPTLLFINSGMAPLKPYFTGAKQPPRPDLCNVQPCVRTRDIDDVGDRHHLTFFEMLGSWSIGHYFKERAVELAYGLLVDGFAFPPDRLYVTVYAGDAARGLAPDEETARAWEHMGIARERIVFLGDDNFWGPAGDSGPCGPCTEVFFDTGEQYGVAYRPGGEFDSKRRYIEIWNAGVFMQFDKRADNTFAPLPFKSVDTGSGLERMAFVLQGVDSVYETDIFLELMSAVRERLGEAAPVESRRVVSDHIRAACFLLAESVVPGNVGRSYIPRRLIRKCVAIVSRSGVSGFDYRGLIDVVISRFQKHYPILGERRKTIAEAFLRETQEFERAVGRGLARLDQLTEQPAPAVISGKDAFDLFATYGLPIELTREFVSERGGRIDEESYLSEYRRHQHISRSPGAVGERTWSSDAAVEAVIAGRTSDFVGYEVLDCDGFVLGLLRAGEAVVDVQAGSRVEVLSDFTPFYPEGGGQVGDTGQIEGPNGTFLNVLDTQRVAGVCVHRAEVVSGTLHIGDRIRLIVNRDRRLATMANHSATHLLNAALRQVLGPHVRQRGSLVDPERLRFDFEHPRTLTVEQLENVEELVNRSIRANHPRETVLTTYQEAVQAGALAIFGESYGESVRMIRFGSASTELCGGTHVAATGAIGAFRIVAATTIARGVRRIQALTGAAAVRYTLEQERLLRRLGEQLRAPVADLPERIEQLLTRKSAVRLAAPAVPDHLDAAEQSTTLPDGTRLFATRAGGSAEHMAEQALKAANDIQGVVVLANEADGKARVVVAVSREKATALHAGRLLNELLPYIDGRGGGSATLARGGGTRPAGIDSLIESVPRHLDRAGLRSS